MEEGLNLLLPFIIPYVTNMKKKSGNWEFEVSRRKPHWIEYPLWIAAIIGLIWIIFLR